MRPSNGVRARLDGQVVAVADDESELLTAVNEIIVAMDRSGELAKLIEDCRADYARTR